MRHRRKPRNGVDITAGSWPEAGHLDAHTISKYGSARREYSRAHLASDGGSPDAPPQSPGNTGRSPDIGTLLQGGLAALAFPSRPVPLPPTRQTKMARHERRHIHHRGRHPDLLQGPGHGQPIVFHHGWPLSSDDWDAQMMFFLREGYCVVAHDRRGHDRSTQTATGNEIDTDAADVAALVRHLDLKNAIHVGHSTGGGEVAGYVARHGGNGRVTKDTTGSAPGRALSEANGLFSIIRPARTGSAPPASHRPAHSLGPHSLRRASVVRASPVAWNSAVLSKMHQTGRLGASSARRAAVRSSTSGGYGE